MRKTAKKAVRRRPVGLPVMADVAVEQSELNYAHDQIQMQRKKIAALEQEFADYRQAVEFDRGQMLQHVVRLEHQINVVRAAMSITHQLGSKKESDSAEPSRR